MNHLCSVCMLSGSAVVGFVIMIPVHLQMRHCHSREKKERWKTNLLRGTPLFCGNCGSACCDMVPQ